MNVVVAALMYNADLKIAIRFVAIPLATATATATHLKIQHWMTYASQISNVSNFFINKSQIVDFLHTENNKEKS